MKKICEIDAALSYQNTGHLPLLRGLPRRGHRVNPDWFDQYFNTAQKKILDLHGYSVRPHPRHAPTIELFIDETDVSDQEWTMIRLLF